MTRTCAKCGASKHAVCFPRTGNECSMCTRARAQAYKVANGFGPTMDRKSRKALRAEWARQAIYRRWHGEA